MGGVGGAGLGSQNVCKEKMLVRRVNVHSLMLCIYIGVSVEIQL